MLAFFASLNASDAVSRSPERSVGETKKDFVAIGYITRTHGIRGDVKVIPLTDIPGRFTSIKKVYIKHSNTGSGELREYYIKSVKKGRDALIVSFTPPLKVSEAEASLFSLRSMQALSLSEAKSIVGYYITVPEDEVPGLDKDQYYHFEIIDMEVYTEDSRFLGRIAGIFSTGSNDVYVVKKKGQDYLIPAVHDVIKEVDVKNKRMIVSFIEGL